MVHAARGGGTGGKGSTHGGRGGRGGGRSGGAPPPTADEERDGTEGAEADEDEGDAEPRAPHEDAGGAEQQRAAAPSVWTLRGKMAGRADARGGKDAAYEAPEEAKAAGVEAEADWLAAYDTAVETYAPPPSDRPVGGLTTAVRKSRRSSAKPDPIKAGRVGLDTAEATTKLSAACWAYVRAYFHAPEDHGKVAVNAHLTTSGYTFTVQEFDAWWNEMGHNLAISKFKAARYETGKRFRAAYWREIGKTTECVLSSALVTNYRAPTVVVDEPVTKRVGEGKDKRLVFDASSPSGAAALAHLAVLRSAKTAEMVAPWRQTAGHGGSEYGKYEYFEALKRAFARLGDVPEFKLWELALADSVVRPTAYICAIASRHV